jgi:hypothetical protein
MDKLLISLHDFIVFMVMSGSVGLFAGLILATAYHEWARLKETQRLKKEVDELEMKLQNKSF